MRQRRERGATLLEIMISLALVLVGMLALFKVLTTSITGSATSSKLSQAQIRLITILESIRHSPIDPTTGNSPALDCLALAGPPVDNIPTNWRNCENACLSLLTVQSHDACLYSMDSFRYIKGPDATKGQLIDRNQQNYILDPRSVVQRAGTNTFVYDVRLVIGWWDDNGTTLPTGSGPWPGYHSMQVRTGVFP